MAMSSEDWEPNNPKTLYELCIDYFINHLELFTTCDDDVYELREGVALLPTMCVDLVKACKESPDMELTDGFLNMFRDPIHCRLRKAKVDHSKVTEKSIEWLMTHCPDELDVTSCPNFKWTIPLIRAVNTYGKSLQVLHLGESANSLMERFHEIEDGDNLEDMRAQGDTAAQDMSQLLLSLPNLRSLSLHGLDEHLDVTVVARFVASLVRPLLRLTHLDLSGSAVHLEALPGFLSAPGIASITSLNLADVITPATNMNRALQAISHLPRLRQLILLHSRDTPMHYPDAESAMAKCMPRMAPSLAYLDLSGTNLCGFLLPEPVQHRLGHGGSATQQTARDRCAIPGLEGRHLEFLGLLGCPDDACHRDNLPAKQVTGEKDEQQVLLAVQTYVNHADLLMKALNQLFHIFRFSHCANQKSALMGILASMKRHEQDKHIQISGSASLFYIMKGAEKRHLNTPLRRSVVRAILLAMRLHSNEATMLRNGLLTLCHFNVPQDLMFEYRTVVQLLLEVIGKPGQEEFIQRIGVYLINSMACQVDGAEKLMVGDYGAIQTMVTLIEHKLYAGVCDEVMEIAWSAMWNVTDETPRNCQRFIDRYGLSLFRECLRVFPQKEELLRNMMGLIGNVAEVKELRPELMNEEYVEVFCELLESTSDGIEVSYNACGVLAHLVADGAAAWTCRSPPRDTVLAAMDAAIRRWQLKTKRNINYRSFEPILRLLPHNDCPQAQHWAVWALCNLTKMYRKRYCPLLEREGGVALLEKLVSTPEATQPHIVSLARQVLDRCHAYQARCKAAGVGIGAGEGAVTDDDGAGEDSSEDEGQMEGVVEDV